MFSENFIKYFKENSLDYINNISKKTLTIIAAHTNSKLKEKTLLHNIFYFLEISSLIIIVNSLEYKDNNIELDIKSKYPDINIIFLYTKNDDYLCYSKYLFVYKTFNELNNYDNIILTNDSFLIVRRLINFQEIFYSDIEETSILASNEIIFHHTDFLRRYNNVGIVKYFNFLQENIINNVKLSYEQLVHKFEINSLQIFNSTNYLFMENKPLNIHYHHHLINKYLNQSNYPIIKLKLLHINPPIYIKKIFDKIEQN